MDAGKSYFFVGIGGSGMMPLAMILAAQGASVAGSDRSMDQDSLPAKFDQLRALGIDLFSQDGSGITSAGQIVVASAAIEASVPDLVSAERIGAKRLSRAELLATLFNKAPLSIGVAGTSGKSTVTGMIGWILHTLDREPTVMNGAVMKNFARPEAPFASALVGEGDVFVSEVDESDGSIALYNASIAVLNNVSLDHKSLEELRGLFDAFLKRSGRAVVNIDNPDAAALAAALPADRLTTYSIERAADLQSIFAEEHPFGIDFMVIEDDLIVEVALQVPGRHNMANALAAIGAVRAAGVSLHEAATALNSFTGLKRRFDRVGEAAGVTVIDDFGHNPDKITATLSTLHAFPGRLLILFQPHGYGPLKVMRRELVESFVTHLGPDDILVLPDPAYFGGTVTRDVTSADIVADIAAMGRTALHLADREAAARYLVDAARPGDRIIVMGARDDTLSQVAAAMLQALASSDRPDTVTTQPS